MNMSKNKLWERFSWFRDDFKNTSQVGNKIRIKGKALYATISKNNRQYIEDELLKSARTLAGKPIDVNHSVSAWEAKVAAGETNDPKPKTVGHILDADYEDGYIEYVAEINDNEYVRKLKDRANMETEAYIEKWGKHPIHGVSVDAIYRYPQNATEKDDPTIPIGIQFVRLSLVEDPETPGISGTTIELMEKSLIETRIVGNLIHDFAPDLFESYQEEVVSKMSEATIEDKPNYVVSNVDTLAYDPRREYDVSRGEIPASEYSFGESPKEPEEEEEAPPEESKAAEEARVDDDEEEKKKKKKKTEEKTRVVIPTVEKTQFVTRSRTPPKEKPKAKESAENEGEEMVEVKPLEIKEKESLREKQDRELRELQTKQFRDRNEIEHVEFHERGDTLLGKLNEIIDTRPKDVEAIREAYEEHVKTETERVRASLQEMVDGLTEDRDALKSKNDELVDAVNAQKTAIESFEATIDEKEQALAEKDAELTEALEEHKGIIENLKKRLGEYEELKGAFESAKEDFTARIEALEAFKTEYDADKTSIEERITAVTEKMSGFDAKLEEMNAEPEENPLEEKVDKLTETVENLRTHLSPSFKTPEVLDEEETESTSLEVNPIIG